MRLRHAVLDALTPEQVAGVLAWVAGGDSGAVSTILRRCGAATASDPLWLFAHCDDGVTWGRFDGAVLALSVGRHPGWPTPLPTRANVQQLRLFGREGEILLWRDEDAPGEHRGRLLRDGGRADAADPARPLDDDDVYLIGATRLVAGSGSFTVVADHRGRTQVMPLAVTAREFEEGHHALALDVRHYFERDGETGAVRIAASRLVTLRRLGPHERLVG